MTEEPHLPFRESSFRLLVSKDFRKLKGVFRQLDIVGERVPLVHASQGMAIAKLSLKHQPVTASQGSKSY